MQIKASSERLGPVFASGMRRQSDRAKARLDVGILFPYGSDQGVTVGVRHADVTDQNVGAEDVNASSAAPTEAT